MTEAGDDKPERVNDRVLRLPLPLPLRDLPLVNCYAIVGTDEITLIDPGWKSAASERVLLAHLATLGAGARDVRRILVTHSHWDHYTQALDWQARYGAEILLGAGERYSIERFDLTRGPFPAQAELLRRAGAEELAAIIAVLPLQDHEQGMPFGPPDRWLTGHEELDCGGATVTAIPTAGHTRGHYVYQLDDLLFSGDHILPRITPSLAFEQAPEEKPLASYLSSLESHLDDGELRLLPAHGPITESVRERTGELLTHHRQRLDTVREHVTTGRETAFAVASAMRWTRRATPLSDLDSVHAMTAVLEVRTHLEHLVDRGELVKNTGETERYKAS